MRFFDSNDSAPQIWDKPWLSTKNHEILNTCGKYKLEDRSTFRIKKMGIMILINVFMDFSL